MFMSERQWMTGLFQRRVFDFLFHQRKRRIQRLCGHAKSNRQVPQIESLDKRWLPTRVLKSH